MQRSLVTRQSNDPDAIGNLLRHQLGVDFLQAASWTFKVLNNYDYNIKDVRWQISSDLLDWSTYSLRVAGDETAFIDQLFDEIFGDPFEPDTRTYDMIPNIITTSLSVITVTTTSGSY